jgi:nucleoside-diphosphate-sugar epimerase
MRSRPKRALVTGGAGFIGSHLVDALLDQGFQVLAADNLVTGRLENLSHLKSRPAFSFVKWDVTRRPPAGIKDALSRLGYLFHLASPASPSESSDLSYLKLATETALVNTLGTRKMLEIARRSGAVFLFTSTSEVYGDPKVHPQTEAYFGNVNPVGSRACYDESKRMGETWVSIFRRKYGLDARIVRVFNTYGPRLHPEDGRVISAFIMKALRGQPLVVHGDGSQTRSFCYVSDLVKGIMAVARSGKSAGEVINLGFPKEDTILETARLIKELTASEAPIVFRRRPAGDPNRRRPDITKARNLLGWQPKVSLREGLKLTIEDLARFK